MILHRQLNTAPVRAADAVPTQQRFEQQRRERLARMRAAAFTPAPKPAAIVIPGPRQPTSEPAPPAEVEEWSFPPGIAPYDVCVPKARTGAGIIAEVAAKHSLTPAILIGRSRVYSVVAARHEAVFRIIMELGYSYPKTGRLFGGRDHTTVLNAIRQHAKSSPEAADQYRRHIDCIDGVRQAKRAEALAMYFDEGIPAWKIAAKLHLSAGAVNRWLLEETERRHGGDRAA